ncbi:hypothetical protein [Saccharopolyspora sp. NPDC002686]|uniref:hypothetical protein n=1 Tax=Saccharopolyspora sp. NPDC002686 TaxID=3154541 RepID=UPI003333C663
MTRAQLADMLADSGRVDGAALALREELCRTGGDEEYEAGQVERSTMLEIYRKRLSRPKFRPVLGAERLLHDFEQCRDETLHLLAFSSGDRGFHIWLDGDASSIVAMTSMIDVLLMGEYERELRNIKPFLA